MPIYEYRCADCGHTFEVFQKFADAPVEECERCRGTVSKVLHPAALHFKGSGFYTTDYGRTGKKPRSANGETEGKKGASGDGEGKPKNDAACGSKSGTHDRKTSTTKVKEASS